LAGTGLFKLPNYLVAERLFGTNSQVGDTPAWETIQVWRYRGGNGLIFIKRYLVPRLVQYFLVIFVGVTAVFLIPRFLPSDPVVRTISELRSRGSYLDPASIDDMVADLTELYGLEGSMFDQYIAFWQRLFRGDFGVSFFQFPTPVIKLIKTALPWTLILLLVTTTIAWTTGILLGGLAGYFNRRGWSRALDTWAMFIRPMPYYVFAFSLLLLFGYIFPLISGFGRDRYRPTALIQLALHLGRFEPCLFTGVVAHYSRYSRLVPDNEAYCAKC
jgi:ABC-type dipeptide/oligopeptide/nickel transport system permease component